MNLTDIINQLESLKRSSEAFADADPEDELWAADIDALNGSTEILTVTPNHGFCHWCGKKLGGW